MIQSNTIKIKFCFPNVFEMNKESFVKIIVGSIKLNRKIGYAGYRKKTELTKYLSYRFTDDIVKKYQQLNTYNQERIERIIRLTIKKCNEQLPLPNLPFFVFIFSWLNTPYNKAFEGVTGFTPFTNTIHLFISLEKFSLRSLEKTIAHELNHSVFFYYHKHNQTLFDIMIFEGLAENFREEIIGGQPALWSKALNEKECKLTFSLLNSSLNSRGYHLYRDVFFGNKKYKRWTGYSIGYRIIKSFRKIFPNKSWKEIMGMKPKNIFIESSFIKK
ncbi:hypothetical protein HY061_00975 [Candidatus Azambacteria bacterium]|nr:hypothetical protein [Candidatus Azambacteria bacterium]